MAVLIEGISVVVRMDAVRAKFPGGWSVFEQIVPNATLCCDDELARVGFMVPEDVGLFIDKLEANGLAFFKNNRTVDIVVVDQLTGPTNDCAWVAYGHVDHGGNRVAACMLKGSTQMQLLTPYGWSYEESLSASYTFMPNEKGEKKFKLLGQEGSLDVYQNMATSEILYMGRTRSLDDVPGAPNRISLQ
jgi:hypothetical protein